MRRIMCLLAFSAAFSMLALAEDSFSGKLLDSSCYDQKKAAAGCEASSATTSFALESNGAVYKLDRGGNTQATSALKNRADRSDPNKPQSKEVMAKVSGTQKDGTITVTTIEVQ